MPSRSTTFRGSTPPPICSIWDTGASAASRLPNSNLNEQRIPGYRQRWQSATCRSIQPSCGGLGITRRRPGCENPSELLREPEPPTAIFAFNDLMAMGVMDVQERGLQIPADVAVIGFDGLAITEHCSPPLSTVEQPVAEMSVAAIAMLLDRIRRRLARRVQTFAASSCAHLHGRIAPEAPDV